MSYSAWSRLDHLVSGLNHVTNNVLKYGFPAPPVITLGLLRNLTHRPIIQKVRRYYLASTDTTIFDFILLFFLLNKDK